MSSFESSSNTILLYKVLDLVPVPVILVSSHGQIEFVSRAATGLLGYSVDEIRGVPLERIVSKEHYGNLAPLVKASLGSEPSYRGEVSILSATDGWVSFPVNAARVGREIAMVIETSQAADDSIDTLRGLALAAGISVDSGAALDAGVGLDEHSPKGSATDALLALDFGIAVVTKGVAVQASSSFTSLFGYGPGEGLPMSLVEHVYLDDYARFEAWLVGGAGHRDSTRGRFRCSTEHGEERVIDMWKSHAEGLEQGSFLVFAADATDEEHRLRLLELSTSTDEPATIESGARLASLGDDFDVLDEVPLLPAEEVETVDVPEEEDEDLLLDIVDAIPKGVVVLDEAGIVHELTDASRAFIGASTGIEPAVGSRLDVPWFPSIVDQAEDGQSLFQWTIEEEERDRLVLVHGKRLEGDPVVWVCFFSERTNEFGMIESLEEEKEVLGARLEEAQERIEHLSATLESLQSVDEGPSLAEEAISHAVDALTAERDALVNEREALSRELDELEEKLGASSDEQDELSKELDRTSRERDALLVDVASLTEARDALSRDMTEVVEEKHTLSAKLAELEGRLEATQEQLTASTEAAAGDDERLSEVETKYFQVKGQYYEARERMEEALGKVEGLEHRIAELEETSTSLRASLDATTTTRDELGATLEVLQAERDELQGTLSSTQTTLDARIAELEGTTAELRASLDDATGTRDELAVEVEGLRAERDELSEAHAAAQASLDAAREEVEGLQAKIADLEREVTTLTDTRDLAFAQLESLSGERDQLELERSLLRRAVAHQPHALVLLDAEGTVLMASDRFVERFGPEETPFEGDVRALVPDVLASWILQDGDAPEETLTLDLGSGPRTIVGQRVALASEGDEPPFVLVALADRTEEIAASEEAAASIDRLQAMVSNAPVPLVAFDREGTIAMANPMAEGLPGFEVGKSLDDLLKPTQHQQSLAPLLKQCFDAKEGSGETVWRLTEGDGKTTVSCELGPALEVIDGRRLAYGMVRDVSAEAEERKTLTKSYARLETIDAVLPGVIFVTNAAGHIRSVNGAFDSYLGKTAPSLAGVAVAALAVEEHRELVAGLFETAAADGTEQRGVVKIVTADDEERWVLVTVAPLTSDTKERALCLIVDLDAEHEARRVLEAGLAFHREAFEECPFGVLVIDSAERVVQVNGSYMYQMGEPSMDPSRHEGRLLADTGLLTAEDLGVIPSIILGGDPVGVEVTDFSPPDEKGNRRHRIRAVPIRADEVVVGGVIAVEDITEQWRVEDHLRGAMERYRSIIKTDVMGVALVKGTSILYANTFLARLLGLKARQELIGHKGIGEALFGGGLDEYVDVHGKGYVVIPYERPDGRSVLLGMTYLMRETTSGPSYVVFVDDVSLQKAQEAEEREAAVLAALQGLTGGLAKSLECHVSTLVAYAAFGREAHARSGDATSSLLQVEHTSLRLSELVWLLEIAVGKVKLTGRTVDLSRAIQDIERNLEARFPDTPVLLPTIEDDVCVVKVDPRQLSKVLETLAVETLGAVTGPRSLEVEVRMRSFEDADIAGRFGEVTCIMPGLAPSDEVVRSSLRPMDDRGKIKGAALAFGMCTAHDGFIEINRQNDDLVLSMYLPAAEGDEVDAAGLQEAEGTSGKVLLIEPADELRALMATILRELGFQVADRARWGQELSAADELFTGVDVVIADRDEYLAAAGRDPDLLQTLTADTPPRKIVTTGVGLDLVPPHDCLVGTLPKPFFPADLRRIIG